MAGIPARLVFCMQSNPGYCLLFTVYQIPVKPNMPSEGGTLT